MKRAQGHGFLLSLIMNMLFRAYWLVLVCVLVILHFVVGWPMWLIVIPIVFWVMHSLLITVILGWASDSAAVTKPVQENKNPYSYKKDSDGQS